VNAYGADAIFTASQEQAHTVAGIQFPVFLGNFQQPAFRDQSVEKREKHLAVIGRRPQRQGETNRLGIRPVLVNCIIFEVIPIFVLVPRPANSL
jgi:hypothetical protein